MEGRIVAVADVFDALVAEVSGCFTSKEIRLQSDPLSDAAPLAMRSSRPDAEMGFRCLIRLAEQSSEATTNNLIVLNILRAGTSCQ